MKIRFPVFSLSVLVPLWLLILVSAAFAQDIQIEKLLNPFADFDPFEAPTATPRFFPDEVDRRARELMIDALTRRNESLADHADFFKTEDTRLRRERGARTGLAEHAQDLANNAVPDRERYIAAQKEAIRNASSPERKKYLEAIVNHDDAIQSERLMRQSSTNFWGGLANRMLGSVDLVGVASGNYIGAAAETTVAQIYSLMDRDMPIEERRALARDLDHLKRFPDDPRNAAIRKQVAALKKKKQSALTRKQAAQAKKALGEGDPERALFHLELAAFIDQLTETYSHGMKQRTVFASALLHEPRVLVVDEPMVGLDPHSIRLVKDLLEWESLHGMCVLMSTHTLAAAEEISDRVGIMNHGRLLFDGTVSQLRRQLGGEHDSLEDLYLEITSRAGDLAAAETAAPVSSAAADGIAG